MRLLEDRKNEDQEVSTREPREPKNVVEVQTWRPMACVSEPGLFGIFSVPLCLWRTPKNDKERHEKKLLYIPKLLSLYIAFPSFGCFFGVYCNIANILLVWICLDVIFVQRDLRGRRAKA